MPRVSPPSIALETAIDTPDTAQNIERTLQTESKGSLKKLRHAVAGVVLGVSAATGMAQAAPQSSQSIQGMSEMIRLRAQQMGLSESQFSVSTFGPIATKGDLSRIVSNLSLSPNATFEQITGQKLVTRENFAAVIEALYSSTGAEQWLRDEETGAPLTAKQLSDYVKSNEYKKKRMLTKVAEFDKDGRWDLFLRELNRVMWLSAAVNPNSPLAKWPSQEMYRRLLTAVSGIVYIDSPSEEAKDTKAQQATDLYAAGDFAAIGLITTTFARGLEAKTPSYENGPMITYRILDDSGNRSLGFWAEFMPVIATMTNRGLEALNRPMWTEQSIASSGAASARAQEQSARAQEQSARAQEQSARIKTCDVILDADPFASVYAIAETTRDYAPVLAVKAQTYKWLGQLKNACYSGYFSQEGYSEIAGKIDAAYAKIEGQQTARK